MSIIVFPGQGSQFVGMSRDFYDNFDSAKHIFSLIQDTTKINIKDIKAINSEVEGLMNSIKEGLLKDNFPDGLHVAIDPVNNAWTDLLRTRRRTKDLVDIYNGIKSKDVDMYESLRTIFKEPLPSDTGMKNNLLIRIDVFVYKQIPCLSAKELLAIS